MTTGRTYNQLHVPRAYTPGKRRISVYWSWSYPWEANRDVRELDNRFSTMTEVRRVVWPRYETPEYSNANFLQGVDGTLELFHLSLVDFQKAAGEATGHPVAVYQRVDQAGQCLPIDERILADTDTMMVFGLDHCAAQEEATAEELEAIRNWLRREGTCLILGPHHDVGATDDFKVREVEYRHHGDRLVPSQQRFSGYARSLLKGLDLPLYNRWGLRPATHPGTRQTVDLKVAGDLDKRGWFQGVSTLIYHQHLPHYEVLPNAKEPIHVLAQQPIDEKHPHPFTEAGNREFNMVVWMPPRGDRGGDIMFADSTIFTTLFGGDESLVRFWTNVATK
jgi:hypothetical protein